MIFEINLSNENGQIKATLNKKLDREEVVGIANIFYTILNENDEEHEQETVENVRQPLDNEVIECNKNSFDNNFIDVGHSDDTKFRLKFVHIDDKVKVMKVLREEGICNLKDGKGIIDGILSFPVINKKQAGRLMYRLQEVGCYAAIKVVDENDTEELAEALDKFDSDNRIIVARNNFSSDY